MSNPNEGQTAATESSAIGETTNQPPPAAMDFLSETDSGEADEDLKFYLSGLFNIETSPAFKQLEYLKTRKDIPAEKYAFCFWI